MWCGTTAPSAAVQADLNSVFSGTLFDYSQQSRIVLKGETTPFVLAAAECLPLLKLDASGCQWGR